VELVEDWVEDCVEVVCQVISNVKMDKFNIMLITSICVNTKKKTVNYLKTTIQTIFKPTCINKIKTLQFT